MSRNSLFGNSLSRYSVLCVLGIFAVYAVAAAYLNTASKGQELGSAAAGVYFSSNPSLPNPLSPELKDIFFDRNSYEIREDAKPVLDENVEVLRSEPGMFVVIESYCDSREESQAHLGSGRGDAVREYMSARGVDEERVLTVNKCGKYDMQLVSNRDTARLDSRVRFVALDESSGRLALLR